MPVEPKLPSAAPCPRCGALVAPSGAPSDQCPDCELVIPSVARAELDYLDALANWIPQRRDWIMEQLAAGDFAGAAPEPDARHAAAPGTSAAPTSVGGCLLTAGAFALVAAGIVFTTFAWSALGDVGQFAVLILAGVLGGVVGWRLAPRLPGAATAISVVGTLLVTVASVYLLAQDDEASAGLRVAIVVVIALLGIAAARAQSKRQRGAAVLTGVSASLLALVAVTVAPVLGALDVGDRTSWWVAGWTFVWAVALYLFDLVDRTVAWSWLAAGGLVVASLVKVSALINTFEVFDPERSASAAWVALILLVMASALLVTDRLTRGRWWSLVAAAVVLVASAAFSVATAIGIPSARPSGALALVGITALLLAGVAHVRTRPSWGSRAAADSVHDVAGVATQAAIWVSVGLMSLAVALAVATWVDPPPFPPACGPVDCVATPAFTAWIDASYPWWRGLMAGLAAVVWMVVAALLVRRRAIIGGRSLPLVAGVLAVVLWIVTVESDAQSTLLGISAVQVPIGVAALTAGMMLIGAVALLQLPSWSVWPAATTAFAGIAVLWPALDAGEWALAPEVLGLLLALPLLLAGMAQVLMDEPKPVSTWLSVAPALVTVLLLPTFAVIDDASTRWLTSVFGDASETTTVGLLRSVLLLGVGAALAVAGARQHWAGVFWPGLGVFVIVTTVQLFDVASLMPYWVTLTVVGLVLVAAGARWESVRLRGRRTRQWAGSLH